MILQDDLNLDSIIDEYESNVAYRDEIEQASQLSAYKRKRKSITDQLSKREYEEDKSADEDSSSRFK